MIDILKSYLNKEDYYIILCKDKLYVKNFNNILELKDDSIIIDINSKLIRIDGKDFKLYKSIDKELLIGGRTESIKL